MLFDLRSPARRRTIKVIYALLAVLMAVGLVGFGIGGNVSGGIFDGVGGCGTPSATQQLEDDVNAAQKRVDQQPQNAAAWASLARARYQLVAGSNDLYDQATGQFTESGQRGLTEVVSAYERYLKLVEKPSPSLARTMVLAYYGLEKPADAVKAQQLATEAEPTASSFFQLASYAYAANEERTAELAARKAIELTPKDQREVVKDRLESAKQQALLQAAQAAGAGGAGSPPPPSG